jgi:CheY-like chemotaxis protein
MPQSISNYQNLRILIAEDDELSYLYIKIILKSITDNFIRVKTGEEVLQCLESEPIDILLLDVNLPDVSGLEVAKVLFEKYPSLGIILNSAFSLEDEREDAMKKSNFQYLNKPLQKEKMLAAIEKVLNSVAHN